jgi:hypothetical protein
MPAECAEKGKADSDLISSLKMMTSKREPHVRSLDPTDLHVKINQRIQNLQAALTQVVGTEAEKECTDCVGGKGPFVACIVSDGDLGGSCANCHWNSMGTQCSLREYTA